MICFFLRIPSGVHSGSWDRIQDMLTISAANAEQAQIAHILLAAGMGMMLNNRIR
jgi:hypothetical protein